MSDPQHYDCDFENKWCPGCGNFGILNSVKDALAELEIPPEKLLLVSGIGQAAKTPHFLRCNFFHGLHGRALAVAAGAKLANHDLNILVHMGDGDCYGEGGNHLMAAIRRNLDMTLLVHDNKVYGLTKGQASPTSDRGFITKAQRHGTHNDAMNPLALALSQGAGFVARGYCGDIEGLSHLIQQAIQYNGFSFIDILQVCVSFNHVNTYGWYNDRVYSLDQNGHDPTEWGDAMKRACEWGDRIPIGLFYKADTEPFTARFQQLKNGPLLKQDYDGQKVQALIDEG